MKKKLDLDDKAIDLDLLAGAAGGCHHSCCGGCGGCGCGSCGGGTVVPVQTQTAWAGHWSSAQVGVPAYSGMAAGNAAYGSPVAAQPAAPAAASGWTLPPTTIT